MKKNAPPTPALVILSPALLVAQRRQIKFDTHDAVEAPFPDVTIGSIQTISGTLSRSQLGVNCGLYTQIPRC